MAKDFIPKDFVIPEKLETDKFFLRMLSVDDVELDYDAVMTSISHLQKTKPFGPNSNFPPKDLTIEEDCASIKIHEKEIQNRDSFAFVVMNPAGTKSLGCVYIYPSVNHNYDAIVMMWVRQSELTNNLDEVLFLSVKKWIQEKWPFGKVAYPGRNNNWSEFI